MDSPIECSGAPRDLGGDQGRSCAADVLRAVGGRVSLARRVDRDVGRYYPHLAERSAGLARGARVARRTLAGLLARELGPQGPIRTGGPALGIEEERSGGAGLLVRALPAPVDQGFVLRRSRPDHGYRSLEVTLPWLAGSLGGVNETGLAATACTLSADDPGPCAAPALLLVQDCLQRFDAAEKAVEWCLARPAGGRAAILVCDAGGPPAAVLIDGPRRRVLGTSDGVLVTPEASPPHAGLEKACREALVLDGVTLQRIFGDAPERLVWLEPAGCRLGLLSGPPSQAEPDGVRFLEV